MARQSFFGQNGEQASVDNATGDVKTTGRKSFFEARENTPIIQQESRLDQFGLPKSTISAPKGNTTPYVEPVKKESFWTKAVKAVLPKKVEDFFGLNPSPVYEKVTKAYNEAYAYEDLQRLQKEIDAGGGKLPKQTAGGVMKETKPEKYIPFLSAVPDIADAWNVYQAAKRLKTGDNTMVDDYRLAKFQAENERDSTFGAKIVSVLTELPSFAGELALTWGVYSVGKAATQKAVTKILTTTAEKSAFRKGAESIATRSIGSIVGGTLQTVPARFMEITEGTIQNMTPEYSFTKDELGKLTPVFAGDGDDLMKSAAKSFSNQWVEVVSEHSGGIFNEMVSPVKNQLLKLGIFKAFLKSNPTATSANFMKWVNRAGWNGIIGEMGEERIGELMRGGLTEVGLSEDGWKIPSKEQLAVELVSFSIPGVMIGAANKTLQGGGTIQEAMNPPTGNEPPDDGGTPPAPIVTHDISEAEQIIGARDLLTVGKTVVNTNSERTDALQKTLDVYHREMATPVIEILNTDRSPIAGIEVIQYPDGKFASKVMGSTENYGVFSDFLEGKLFKTREQAVEEAKQKLLSWANTTLENKTADPVDIATLKDIVNHIQRVEATSDVPIEVRKEEKATEKKKPEGKEEELIATLETKIKAGDTNFIKKMKEKAKSNPKLASVLADAIATAQARVDEEKNNVTKGKTYKDENQVYYKKGDKVIDDEGNVLTITAGNEPGKDYPVALTDQNAGFVRVKGEGDKQDYIYYTNRISKVEATQKEKVAEAVKETPKTIKEIAEETKILEPNVRRILGVGAKEGTFERVDKGVYILKKDGKQLAYIETGSAMEALPRLAKEGLKADMIFLDIPYKTPAVSGGNRGAKFDFITVDEFETVIKAVKDIARDESSPVFYMYSQAPSGIKQMQKYTDKLIDNGFKPVARGEYTKLQMDGVTRTRNMRGVPDYPEGIILFTQTGETDIKNPDLNFKLIRPMKGWQTEKPAEMLRALIEMSTKEGEVVLDPFAGSGVTGEQAIEAGRETVAIEKSEKAVEKYIKPRFAKASAKVSAKDEFKVGDILDPQGKTNMVGKVTIREITGNTLKFTDAEGTDYAGMDRATVRTLIKEGSWKREAKLNNMSLDLTSKVLTLREKAIAETKTEAPERKRGQLRPTETSFDKERTTLNRQFSKEIYSLYKTKYGEYPIGFISLSDSPFDWAHEPAGSIPFDVAQAETDTIETQVAENLDDLLTTLHDLKPRGRSSEIIQSDIQYDVEGTRPAEKETDVVKQEKPTPRFASDLTLAPSKTKKSEEVKTEVKRIFGKDNVTKYERPLLGRIELKTLLSNSDEFKADPYLIVTEDKSLSFTGKKHIFSIKSSALGLNADNLNVGDKIFVDKNLLNEKGNLNHQVRVFDTTGQAMAATMRDFYKYTTPVEEARAKLRELFDEKEVGFLINNDLLDDDIAGQWSRMSPYGWRSRQYASLIQLVEKDGKVPDRVLYHEAFHAYFNTFLSRNERAFALKTIKDSILTKPARFLNDHEAYDTEDKLAEEWLADDFARFVADKKSVKYTGLRGIYENILKKLREFIRKAGNIEKIYNDILNKERSGVYSTDAQTRNFARKKVELDIAVLDNEKPDLIEQLLKEVDNLAPKGSMSGGQGNVATFNEGTPVLEGSIDKIRPIQTPEMVELVKQLTGDVPVINARLRTKLGVFWGRGAGEIQLRPDIFKDPIQVAKTLAHEIGHLADWLPRLGAKRTSLLQKLYILKNHIKGEFGDQIVKNKDIKEELWNLSTYWRPLGKNPPASFLKYRNSANELYADAISVLFNSPGLLEKQAPTFYKAFFASLDEKADVNEKYWEIQDMLFGAKEELYKAREERIRKGFEKGADIQKSFEEKKKKSDGRLAEKLRQQLDDRYYPALKKVYEAEARGEIVDDSANPKYLFQELAYVNNENYLLVEQLDREVSRPVKEAGMDDEDIGTYLLLNRISTERKEIANPYGFDVNSAQEQLDYLRQRVGDENYKLLQEKVGLFHDIVFKSVEKAVEVGAYNKELFTTTIKPNKANYATFAVVDYLQDYVPATVKKQIGTFKEVANPYHLTILKTAALNKLNATQEAKNSMRDVLQTSFPTDITPSKKIGGKISIFKTNRNEKLSGQLQMLEDGKLMSYDVDPYIAKSFEIDDPDNLNMGIQLLGKINQVFKSIVTTYNLGFAVAFNPIRDFKRNYKNIKNATLLNLATAYIKSLPSATRYASGKLDDFTRQMVADKVMNAPIFDYNYDPREDEMGSILEKYGVISRNTPESGVPSAMKKARRFLLKPVIKLLDAMRFAANTFEVVSKIAGTKLRMSAGEAGKGLAYNVRNFTGTPNWKVRGTQTNTTNEIFIFSNIMKEGLKSDFIIATDPTTRSGYWWKTVKIDLTPKFLMFLAAAGAFGEGLRELFAKMNEYDKTNYITIPLGERNGKAVYARIPHDETGRLISAMFWKGLNFAKDRNVSGLQDIVALGAGQMPNVTPVITFLQAWGQYLSGKNPYDAFRGRTLIDDTTFQAGGTAGLKKMVQWSANNFGLSQFTTYDPARNDTVETSVQILPLINRVFKISDYGISEKSMKLTNEIKTERAREVVAEKAVISKYVAKYKDAYATGEADLYTIGDEVVREVLGHDAITDEEYSRDKSMRTRLKTGMVVGAYDARVDNLVYSASNREKIALLQQYQKEMTADKFDELIDTLYDEKIVSGEVLDAIGK